MGDANRYRKDIMDKREIDELTWFHRPLSDYWKAFKAARFVVLDFEEPRITEERYHLARNPRELANGRTRPYSVAFKLQKGPGE